MHFYCQSDGRIPTAILCSSFEQATQMAAALTEIDHQSDGQSTEQLELPLVP